MWQIPLDGHRLRTPATDTTNGQAHNNSTTNLPHRNARAQHLDMSRCWDVANFCPLLVFVAGVHVLEFVTCCTTSTTCCELVRWWCWLVVFVAGVRRLVADVCVVEFGSYWPAWLKSWAINRIGHPVNLGRMNWVKPSPARSTSEVMSSRAKNLSLCRSLCSSTLCGSIFMLLQKLHYCN